MVQVKVNEAAREVFGPLKEQAEVFDDRGTLLGYFIPAEDAKEQLRKKAYAEYDPEKLRRLKESREDLLTTEQVLEHLRSS